jgi:Holliday junction resolvase-like predicted endonuclease
MKQNSENPLDKKQPIGVRGELIAQEEYKKRGYKIFASNVFNRKGKRAGEIDFIAIAKDHIAFVEVKTRSSTTDRFGGGRFAVSYFKQQKLLKIVKMFLLRHAEFRKLRPQIDVCLVEPNKLDKTAFSVTIIPNTVMDDR